MRITRWGLVILTLLVIPAIYVIVKGWGLPERSVRPASRGSRLAARGSRARPDETAR